MIQKNITVFPNGHLVSRTSDYIIYSVEAELVDRVVGEFAQCVFLCSSTNHVKPTNTLKRPSMEPLWVARRLAKSPRLQPSTSTSNGRTTFLSSRFIVCMGPASTLGVNHSSSYLIGCSNHHTSRSLSPSSRPSNHAVQSSHTPSMT